MERYNVDKNEEGIWKGFVYHSEIQGSSPISSEGVRYLEIN